MTHARRFTWLLFSLTLYACHHSTPSTTGSGPPSTSPSSPTSAGEPSVSAPPDNTLYLLTGALGGAGNTDGSGTTARFYQPLGIAAASDAIYVADSSNNTIRKIDRDHNTVTTLAGSADQTGTDDGVGSAARFFIPQGIALYGGNLYVADQQNQSVRRIDLATKAVTTIVGKSGESGTADGTLTDARLFEPTALCFTNAQTMYIGENAQRIRKVDFGTGLVSSVAGAANQRGAADGVGTTARLANPFGLACEPEGNVYIADSSNHAIRRLDTQTGQLDTIAGTLGVPGIADGIGTSASFTSPDGLVLADSHTLYVVHRKNTIRKIDLATLAVTTFVGTGEPSFADGTPDRAAFRVPEGIAGDGTALFVADTANQSIRRVDVDSRAVRTLAGLASGSGTSDGTLATARFGNFTALTAFGGHYFVGDTYNHLIRKVDPIAGTVTHIADGLPPNTIGNIWSLVADQSGNLFFYDEHQKLYRYDAQGGSVAWLSGSGSIGADDGLAAQASYRQLNGLAFGDDGQLYGADTYNHVLRRISPLTGEVRTVAGTTLVRGFADGIGTAAKFDGPYGVTSVGHTIVFSDASNDQLRQLDLATLAVTTLAGATHEAGVTDGPFADARFNYPSALATDGIDTVYVIDRGNYTVRRAHLGARTVDTLVGAPRVGHVTPGALPALLGVNLQTIAFEPTGRDAGLLSVGSENSLLQARLVP